MAKILDTAKIRELTHNGWTDLQIAKYFGVSIMSVIASRRRDQDDDPMLRERWNQRIPILKAQLKQMIAATAPAPDSKSKT